MMVLNLSLLLGDKINGTGYDSADETMRWTMARANG